MKIAISQQEIDTALRSVITGMGFDLTGKQVTVEYSMGRKGKGLSAEANISLAGSTPVAPVTSTVSIPGLTDSDEPEPEIVQATEVKLEEDVPEVTAGVEAAALFGDDD